MDRINPPPPMKYESKKIKSKIIIQRNIFTIYFVTVFVVTSSDLDTCFCPRIKKMAM